MGTNKYNIGIVLLLTVLGTITVNGQTNADIEKIAASQSGASALFFDATAKSIPLIEPGVYNNTGESTVRSGLPNFFKKISGKQEITVAFIGGSITQGNYCYRLQTAKYLQRCYPRVHFKWINAGVSGTGTDLGAFRLKEQVLMHRPDLVFIEFAVNGAYADGMEGMIRQTIQQNPETDICLIYTILNGQTAFYQRGDIPDNIKKLEKLADHYQLPSFHLGMEAAALEQEGRLIWKGNEEQPGKILFSNDGIHPLQAGGNLYAAAIARGIQKASIKEGSQLHILKAPLLTASWDKAGMYDPDELAVFDEHWEMKDPQASPFLKKFSNWFNKVAYGENPGAAFTFRFDGDMFGIFDIGGPEVGQLEFEVDGNAVSFKKCSAGGFNYYQCIDNGELSALNRFNFFCNNRYRGQHDVVQLLPGVHTVTVKISKQKSDKKAILTSARSEDIIQHPEKYDRTAVYIGKILLRGVPVK